MTRDNIDDTVHCVCAPERATWSAHDFDALDIFEKHVLHVPEHAGVQRRIDASPVNQYEKFIGSGAVETSCRNGILIRIYACHLEVRCKTQYLRDAGRSGPAYVVVSSRVSGLLRPEKPARRSYRRRGSGLRPASRGEPAPTRRRTRQTGPGRGRRAWSWPDLHESSRSSGCWSVPSGYPSSSSRSLPASSRTVFDADR